MRNQNTNSIITALKTNFPAIFSIILETIKLDNSQKYDTNFENGCYKFKNVLNELSFYLIETPFHTFANRADPDQAALVRAA